MNERFYKLPVEIAGRRDLTSAGKVVWAALTDRMGKNGFCWPGMRTVAKDTGLGLRTVERVIKKLEDAGLLKVERRGNGQVNHYRLLRAEGVAKMTTPAKQERGQNDHTGVAKMATEAWPKWPHNQTKEPDQLNQTKKERTDERGKNRDRVKPVGEFVR
jgi:DNA-binding transcriptional ArsR family regulator